MKDFYRTRYQSGSFCLINVGSGFHCLRSFFIYLFLFRYKKEADKILPENGNMTHTCLPKTRPITTACVLTDSILSYPHSLLIPSPTSPLGAAVGRRQPAAAPAPSPQGLQRGEANGYSLGGGCPLEPSLFLLCWPRGLLAALLVVAPLVLAF